jgi:hypothetical protein
LSAEVVSSRRRGFTRREVAVLLSAIFAGAAGAAMAHALTLWLLIGVTLIACLVAIAWPGDRGGPLSFMAAFAMFFIIGYVVRAISFLSGSPHHVFPGWSLPDPDLTQLMRLGLAARGQNVFVV